MAAKKDDEKRKERGSTVVARQARLARALRANLGRRKAQVRARGQDNKGGKSGAGSP